MLIFPLIILIIAIVLEYSGLDVWWGSYFYDFQNHIWPYKHHWFFEGITHKGGQWFDKIMGLIWLFAFILTFFRKDIKKHRKIMLYVLVATAAGPILVSIGKQLTHIYTPWDLQMFGGKQPYIRLLDTVPAGAPIGHAFPAGHASGGYCFLSFYFVMLRSRSSYRFLCFFIAICLGLFFGIGQQIRGAHFPSHDLFTLAICWYAAMTVYFLFYLKEWKALKQY